MKQEKNIDRFTRTLLETNRAFNFYVNWKRPKETLKKYKLELNILNALIKNEDYDSDFKKILKKLPTVVNLFPTLFALSKTEKHSLERGNSNFKVVNSSDFSDEDNASFEDALLEYKFDLKDDTKLTDIEIEKYLDFSIKMGIKYLFTELLEQHLLDYVIGCEIGLDSNARKNRGGMAFELALEPLIKEISEKHNITMYTQKKLGSLSNSKFSISKDIENRRADFILVKGDKAMNIEVNFFGGPGSKPQEIIDAYINRQGELRDSKIHFALITDGASCWGVEGQSQLAKGFNYLDCLLNYNMVKEGMLEEFIVNSFNIDLNTK